MAPNLKCVLCVDDDPAILQLHQRLLEGAGYFVLSAHSGAEALELLVRDHVDVVVLDNAMPGMNGDELAVQLRRRYPKLPLVAVSGVEELPPAMLQAVDSHLLKGIHPERIVSTVAEVLARTAKSSADSETQKKVLCVEDEQFQLELRRSVLTSAGFKVLGARTAQEAMEIFEAEQIDLVVMDYWLSAKNGTAVAEDMKRLRPGTPIIMLSGFSSLPGKAQWWMRGFGRPRPNRKIWYAK